METEIEASLIEYEKQISRQEDAYDRVYMTDPPQFPAVPMVENNLGLSPGDVIPVDGKMIIPKDIYQEISSFDPKLWLDSETLYQILKYSLSDPNAVIYILEKRILQATTESWQVEVLLNSLFTQDDVNYLFVLTQDDYLDFGDEQIFYNPRIRTVIEEVWTSLLRIRDPKIVPVVEKLMITTQYFEIENPFYFWKQLVDIISQGLNGEFFYDILVEKTLKYAEIALPPEYLINNPHSTVETLRKIRKEIKTYLPPNLEFVDLTELNKYLENMCSLIQFRMTLIKSDFLFKVFGPSHRRVDSQLIDDSVCSRYGGCRMLLCECLEKDWFKGYCQFCLQKIEKRRFAVRKPSDNGGWEGCYCSINCVWNVIYANEHLLAVMIFQNIVIDLFKYGIFR